MRDLLDGAILKDLMVCLSRTKQEDGLTIPSPFTDMKVPKVLPKKTGQPCSCSTCHHVHHVQQESGVTKVQTNKKSLETQQSGRFLTTWITTWTQIRFSGDHPETLKLTTRWWFQICFLFIPTWGNDPIWLYLTNIFQMGWNHQPDNHRTWKLLVQMILLHPFGSISTLFSGTNCWFKTSHSQPPGMFKNKRVNNRISDFNYQPPSSGFLGHQISGSMGRQYQQ